MHFVSGFSFSVLEIIPEISDVSVFNNTCVKWQINPGSIIFKIVYVVSKVIHSFLLEQKWYPTGTRLGDTSFHKGFFI